MPMVLDYLIVIHAYRDFVNKNGALKFPVFDEIDDSNAIRILRFADRIAFGTPEDRVNATTLVKAVCAALGGAVAGGLAFSIQATKVFDRYERKRERFLARKAVKREARAVHAHREDRENIEFVDFGGEA